jgi:AmiR/NasT family two-component response regulator
MLASPVTRHRARRLKTKAVLRLTERHNVDDVEAYWRLPRKSMRPRFTVEDFCSRILDSGGLPPPPERLADSG